MIAHAVVTGGAVTVTEALPSDPCSLCGAPDCLQQSLALSFIGQRSWPALQHAICWAAGAYAPSAHVAHADITTPTATSRHVTARFQRAIQPIVVRGRRPSQNCLTGDAACPRPPRTPTWLVGYVP